MASILLLPISAIVIVFYSQLFKFIFLKKEKLIINYGNCDFIYGIFFLTFISYFINIFFPLKYFSLIIFTIGIVGFFYLIYSKKLILSTNYILFLFFIVFFLIITHENDLMYDSKLYHFQIIKYNFEHKIIFGLSNLDPRLGFISSWHQFLSLFGFNNHLVSNLNIVLISFIFNIIFSKNFFIVKTSRLFLFFSILFLIVYSLIHPKLNGTIFMALGSPESDTIGMMFLILSVYLFLENNKNYYLLIISIILCATSKLSYIGVGFILLYLLITKTYLFKNYIIIFFIFLWGLIFLFKSYVLTGCLLFPVLQTCLDTFWTMKIENIEIVKNMLQNWSKDQPFRQLYMKPEMFTDFKWFYSWFSNYFLKTSFVQILLSIFFTSLIFIFIKKKSFPKLLKSKKIYLTFLTLISVLIIWFQAPAIRYGYGGILSISMLLFSIAVIETKFKLRKYLFNKNLLMLCLFLIVIKNYSGFNFVKNDRLVALKSTNLSNFKPVNYIVDKNFNKIENIYIDKSRDGFCFNLKQICSTAYNLIEIKPVPIRYINTYIFYSRK